MLRGDWFDFLWYISRGTTVNIDYFKSIAVQLEQWPPEKNLQLIDIVSLLEARVEEVDLSKIKADVLPFVKDKDSVNAWTTELFRDAFQRLIK